MPSDAQIIQALTAVQDPEIGLSIVDLGLVYRTERRSDSIEVDFTLTYPGCPAEGIIRRDIVAVLQDVFGVADVKATTVWSPMWGPERMSEEARVALGYPI